MAQIPVVPLSYGDAFKIMAQLAGPEVPTDWQGGMNFTYRLGPGFARERRANKLLLRVEVNSRLEMR